MAVKFSNNATTTLSANVSAGATSFSVDSASTFPTLGTGDWCYITLSGSATEVVKVTDIDGTTFTCEALANSYSSGDAVGLRVSAETLDDVYSWADKISVDGTGVDVTGTATMDGLTVSGAQNSNVAYFDDSSEAGPRQLQFTYLTNDQYLHITSQDNYGGLVGRHTV